MLNRNVGALLAIFLGLFGAHQFYIGRWWTGALQFALFTLSVFISVVGAPEALLAIAWISTAVIPVLTGILWFAMPSRTWHDRYDPTAERPTFPISNQQPAMGDSSQLKAEGITYYRSADYDLAAEAFTEAISVDYSDPGSHFNLACSYAQLGRYPETLHHLELSVTFGLPKPERIEKHPALGALRKLPAFDRFRANNYRRRAYVTDHGQRDATTPVPPTEKRNPEPETITDFNTPPPSQTTTGASVDGDLLEQISRLRELHDAGVLTTQEYQLQKERLLA
ncbi:NINE protein [Neolewinella antarctica]|uniref:Tetratricopeptide (TPR) repeat protein n=1 Tax=Neolewinella antarctica TaxID=442734 RepID=A0ABX0XBM0_9BACT|nr:NINE protein [Neolewinella antarctica]NJC26324.1 tetratricopeptide (TPR) repeat protein [Neolewinella antarctica]